ncbi:MAG: putative metal-dependent hydrolase [Cryomorphaceae bacterium]|jgi:predicted metal-dependent hydrolase
MNANTKLTPATEIGAQSQSKLPIERRIVRFDYTDIKGTKFHSGNPVLSAFWVGLSATFPLGEAEFIRSVKLFEGRVIDPKLKADVADFAAQEAHHGLQHKKLNKHFDDNGFSTKKVEALIGEEINKRSAKWSDKKRLMHTVCAEHVTAVMAHYALTHPNSMHEVPESFRNMFLWHAIEEIEHKSVAFDVYQSTVGDMAALKRHYFGFIFYEFPLSYFLITRFLLKDRGHKATWAERKGLFKFLFGKGGMISSVKHLYMMFFKKGFHPWNHDDSALIGEWKDKLAPFYDVQAKN